MTTPTDNAALCKNCNSPLGNHIIPKNNCPHGFDYYHAERFFEPQDKAHFLTKYSIDQDIEWDNGTLHPMPNV